MELRNIKSFIFIRLGAQIYSLMFFANAAAALLGIFVSVELLPLIGYHGVFIFYGTLTLLSGIMLVAFKDVVSNGKTREGKPIHKS